MKKDLGSKVPEISAVMENPIKKEKYYPSFSICSDVLPEVVDYKVGEEIEMNITCKVKGLREAYDKKGEYDADIQVKKAEIVNLKDDRKESKRLGIEKKDYDELKKKKEKYA